MHSAITSHRSALARGFSAGEVAEMLGHSDGGALVLRVYGHVIRGELRRKVANLSMTGTVLLPVITNKTENGRRAGDAHVGTEAA